METTLLAVTEMQAELEERLMGGATFPEFNLSQG